MELKEYQNNVNFYDLKEKFIQYIDVSEKTVETYSGALKQFLKYMEDNGIKNPTREDIIAYREFQKEHNSLNTVNGYMIALRNFFKFLEYSGIYKNITENVKGVKISELPKKQILTEEQVKTIYNSLTDAREKCMFSLMITTGLRGVEVANAKIEDIKLHNGEYVLWVQCKGHQEKDEYVKLSSLVLKDIVNYIGTRDSGYIFTSTSNHNNGGGVTTTTLRRMIKAIFKRFGLDSDSFSLHSTRRTAATLMYENGVDTFSIQQILHHKSQTTTTRYINAITRNNNRGEYIVSNAILG